jgi:hypothetical protein
MNLAAFPFHSTAFERVWLRSIEKVRGKAAAIWDQMGKAIRAGWSALDGLCWTARAE